jgi:DNA-binding NarL/FixJ family response regulator
MGNADSARALHEESLSLSLELGDRWLSAISLGGLAMSATASGQPEAAAKLLGAGDAVLDAIGAPRPAYFQPLHDRSLAELEKRLGAAAFEAARGAGRSLTPDQAPSLLPAPVAGPADRPDGLTAREVEVLELVAEGLTDAQIADRLVVSLRTVHAHLRSIYRKLDVRSRSAATRYALDSGLAGSRASAEVR